MEVVREKHLEPPARTDMTLAGAKALLKAAEAAAPDDLARRAAAVTTEAQLAALFRDLWPGGAATGDGRQARSRGRWTGSSTASPAGRSCRRTPRSR